MGYDFFSGFCVFPLFFALSGCLATVVIDETLVFGQLVDQFFDGAVNACQKALELLSLQGGNTDKLCS